MPYWRTIRLCILRNWQRLKADPSVPIVMLAMTLTEAIIVALIFPGLDNTASRFYARGAAVFLPVLPSAFGSIL
jgi:ATP-binding cassette subfamily G (WHITE) protein 2 (PDR)